jgi:hypothetical protein
MLFDNHGSSNTHLHVRSSKSRIRISVVQVVGKELGEDVGEVEEGRRVQG